MWVAATYDNRDLRLIEEAYHTSVTGSHCIARRENAYDAMGKRYQRGVYKVNDLNGNMTDLPKPGNWTTECAVTWDARNRPATFNDGTLITYRYDALHRRIAKITGEDDPRHFFFDNQWRPIEERVDDAVKTHFRQKLGHRANLRGSHLK